MSTKTELQKVVAEIRKGIENKRKILNEQIKELNRTLQVQKAEQSR